MWHLQTLSQHPDSIQLCHVNGGLQSHPIMQYVISAEAMKTISSDCTLTHKNYIWYVLKPAAWLDTNPISGQFCNCERTLKSSSQPAGRPTPDVPWTRRGTVLTGDDRWALRYQRPTRQSLSPADCVHWQQWATYKAGGRRRRTDMGKEWWVGDTVLGNRAIIHPWVSAT